jgi:hypothetical protein
MRMVIVRYYEPLACGRVDARTAGILVPRAAKSTAAAGGAGAPDPLRVLDRGHYMLDVAYTENRQVRGGAGDSWVNADESYSAACRAPPTLSQALDSRLDLAQPLARPRALIGCFRAHKGVGSLPFVVVHQEVMALLGLASNDRAARTQDFASVATIFVAPGPPTQASHRAHTHNPLRPREDRGLGLN